MCSQTEILLRKENLAEEDAQYVERLVQEANLRGYTVYYEQIMRDKEKAKVEKEEYLASLDPKERKRIGKMMKPKRSERKRERKKTQTREIKSKTIFSELEKNTISLAITGFNGECLCSFHDGRAMKELLRQFLSYFDEVYFQPATSVIPFTMEMGLGYQTEKTVSLSKKEDRYFVPGMGWSEMVKIEH